MQRPGPFQFAAPSSFHLHTTFSDGRDSVAAMVAAAVSAGFREVGISDHLVLHPTLPGVAWSMRVERLPEYVAAVQAAAAGAPIPVRLGLEVDYFPDHPRQAELAALLAGLPLDYTVGSVHYLDTFPVDGRAEDWVGLTPAEVNDRHRRYWETLRRLADSRRFDIVGHLDLPKKFGFRPTADLAAVSAAALDAIAAAGMVVEINTAGWDRPCAEPYPAAALVAACRRRGIRLMINDDAHASGEVGRHFAWARALLAAAG